jgi:hypothetical protein
MSRLLFVASLLLSANLALSTPIATDLREFRYIGAGRELGRPTYSQPATFNGVAIGTTELNSTVAPGTTHSLADGHHFFHPGWYLSNGSEPVWEYAPDRRNSSSARRVRRSIDGTIEVKMIVDPVTIQYLEGPAIDFANAWEDVGRTAFEIQWESWGVGEMFLDVFDDGAFVTSSSALIGDLANIFYNAFEIFF